jgi:group I intron endonuclease
MMNGKIYKITNIVNSKIYIGQTIQEKLEKRLTKHIRDARNKTTNSALHNSIRKYGFENFVIELIEDKLTTKIDLDRKEKFWISSTKSNVKAIGYNLTNGGSGILGFRHSVATKNYMKERMSGNNNPFFGQRHSEKMKRFISESGKGRVPWNKGLSVDGHPCSEETKQAVSKAQKGKIVSELSRKHMSDAHLGKVVAEKTRNKISKTQKLQPKFLCENCGTLSIKTNYIQWHGPKCRLNKNFDKN